MGFCWGCWSTISPSLLRDAGVQQARQLTAARQGFLLAMLDRRSQIVAIHPRDGIDADLLRARFLALTVQRAVPKALHIHLRDHAQRTAEPLRLTLRQKAEV